MKPTALLLPRFTAKHKERKEAATHERDSTMNTTELRTPLTKCSGAKREDRVSCDSMDWKRRKKSGDYLRPDDAEVVWMLQIR